MDGRVDGGGGGSALAEEGRVTSSAVREGEGGGRGRRGGGREDGRTAGWPRWRHPCGAREQGQRWPTGTSVASASVAVWQTPPMHPLLPLRSSPALTPWRATPPPAEHAPLRESDRPSPPPPPPPVAPTPCSPPFVVSSLFFLHPPWKSSSTGAILAGQSAPKSAQLQDDTASRVSTFHIHIHICICTCIYTHVSTRFHTRQRSPHLFFLLSSSSLPPPPPPVSNCEFSNAPRDGDGDGDGDGRTGSSSVAGPNFPSSPPLCSRRAVTEFVRCAPVAARSVRRLNSHRAFGVRSRLSNIGFFLK